MLTVNHFGFLYLLLNTLHSNMKMWESFEKRLDAN